MLSVTSQSSQVNACRWADQANRHARASLVLVLATVVNRRRRSGSRGHRPDHLRLRPLNGERAPPRSITCSRRSRRTWRLVWRGRRVAVFYVRSALRRRTRPADAMRRGVRLAVPSPNERPVHIRGRQQPPTLSQTTLFDDSRNDPGPSKHDDTPLRVHGPEHPRLAGDPAVHLVARKVLLRDDAPTV